MRLCVCVHVPSPCSAAENFIISKKYFCSVCSIQWEHYWINCCYFLVVFRCRVFYSTSSRSLLFHLFFFVVGKKHWNQWWQSVPQWKPYCIMVWSQSGSSHQCLKQCSLNATSWRQGQCLSLGKPTDQ